MDQIQKNGWGCLVYLRQEGRGIGLHAKIQAYNLQDKGVDTHDANLMLGHPVDARNYNIASIILSSIGIQKVCLLTNNPEKISQLEHYGIEVAESKPLVVGIGESNRDYMATKVGRMGHSIDDDLLN
jgi:GTP cyclohydrolase II